MIFSRSLKLWNTLHCVYHLKHLTILSNIHEYFFKNIMISRNTVSWFTSCEDTITKRGMKIMATPLPGDPTIVSGSWYGNPASWGSNHSIR